MDRKTDTHVVSCLEFLFSCLYKQQLNTLYSSTCSMLNVFWLPSLRKLLFHFPFLLCPLCKRINLYFGLILTLILINYLLLLLLLLPLPVSARPTTFWTSLPYVPYLSTAAYSGLYVAVQVQLCHSAHWLKHKQLQRPKNSTGWCSAQFPAWGLCSINQPNTLKIKLLAFLDSQAHGQGLPEIDLQERRCLPCTGEYLDPHRLMMYGLNSISRLYHRDVATKWVSGKPGSLQGIKTIVVSLSMVMYCMSDRLKVTQSERCWKY